MTIMTSSTKAISNLFHENIPGYAPPAAVYETYTDADGEEKRRKKEIPDGLSSRDKQILQKVRRRAHKLDKEFSIFGLAFGWGFIITLIPGFGDALNVFLNYYLIAAEAEKAELPKWLEKAMFNNQAISFLFGLVPILGDIASAIFGCNARNVALLEEYLTFRGAQAPESEIIKPGGGPPPAPTDSGQRLLVNPQGEEV